MVTLDGARSEPTVAVDAMGGDHAPYEVVKGAAEAHRQGAKVVLVGQPESIEPILEDFGALLPIVQAADVIPMEESVAQAVRRRTSSLHVAADLVEAGDAGAVVSCGNSAAIMAVTLTTWGRQVGIDRPAFGGTLPSRNGGTFVLDIGANTNVKAANLVQFAVMGDVYARLATGAEPRVALLSNGSEDSKGTRQIKEANEALRKLDMDFIGNVEGNAVFEGAADVVVTDGFTGNVLLKAAEGAAMEIVRALRSELTKDVVSRLAAATLRPAFTRVKKRADFEEYGGAPVLGVNGVMINCHGRSQAKAVTNAIFLARRMAHEHLVERIGEALRHDEVEVRRRRRRLARALRLGHHE